MIRRMEETRASDYEDIGLRSGLEIHQQLDTEKKLFCRCPVKPYSDIYDAQILRHMRPTLSELGEYNGTALMEFKTKKNIIYRINRDTICTYEIDDNPPFELNRQALEFALEITMLLQCSLVSEIHVQRKQYLDGSIPAGFQRTTILGVDGWVPYRDRRISIVQLGLEEDACREVSDRGHQRVYLTDRLGIPLIETVTGPDMRTPREVAEVAFLLSSLARASGKVRRGIGAARQDVNVSVRGGRRVEIKGVSRIPEIPLLVHNEAFRQVSLLEIREELRGRGISEESFEFGDTDVTEAFSGTDYAPVATALGSGGAVRAVVLRGYRGILSKGTQPGKTFADEISDRVRVIACLDELPNILHDGNGSAELPGSRMNRIRDMAGCGPNDAVVAVWGGSDDLDTAVREIVIRAREALDGVCNETRQSFPDGTNGFERILPGPDRMYPDTDLPPLAIEDEMIDRVRKNLPERPWERESRYLEAGAPAGSARQMSISPDRFCFDEALETTEFSARVLMHFFLSSLNHLRRKHGHGMVKDEQVLSVLEATSSRGMPVEAAVYVLESLMRQDCVKEVPGILEDLEVPRRSELKDAACSILSIYDGQVSTEQKLERFVTGEVRERFQGIPGGRQVREIVEETIAGR